MFIHHIVPKSRGGSDNEGNLINLCLECHGKAHDVTFKSNGGLIKESIRKYKSDREEAEALLGSETFNEWLFLVEDDYDDLYKYLISGFNLEIIDGVDIYRLLKYGKNKKLRLRLIQQYYLVDIWNQINNSDI